MVELSYKKGGKTMKRTMLACLLLLICSFPAFSFGVGARAMGMGGAYTALANDITSAYWNPAGLINSKIESWDAMLAAGVDGNFGFDKVSLLSDPRRAIRAYWSPKSADFHGSVNGILGGSFNKIGISYLPWSIITFFKDPAIPPASVNYEKKVMKSVAVTFGTSFASPTTLIASPIAVGVNLRGVNGELYRENYAALGPVNIIRATCSGIGLDIGAQADLDQNTKAGLVFRDILRGNAWSGIMDTYPGGYGSGGDPVPGSSPTIFNENETTPMHIVLGVAKDIPETALLSADIDYAEPYVDLRIGAEKKVLDGMLALRIGYYTLNASTSGITLGAGVDLNGVKVDIATGQENTASEDKVTVLTISGIM